jgi:hypothetical protein
VALSRDDLALLNETTRRIGEGEVFPFSFEQFEQLTRELVSGRIFFFLFDFSIDLWKGSVLSLLALIALVFGYSSAFFETSRRNTLRAWMQESKPAREELKQADVKACFIGLIFFIIYIISLGSLVSGELDRLMRVDTRFVFDCGLIVRGVLTILMVFFPTFVFVLSGLEYRYGTQFKEVSIRFGALVFTVTFFAIYFALLILISNPFLGIRLETETEPQKMDLGILLGSIRPVNLLEISAYALPAALMFFVDGWLIPFLWFRPRVQILVIGLLAGGVSFTVILVRSLIYPLVFTMLTTGMMLLVVPLSAFFSMQVMRGVRRSKYL